MYSVRDGDECGQKNTRLVGRAGGCGVGRRCSKSVSLRKPHLSLDLGIICGEPGTDGPGRDKSEREPHAGVLSVLEGKQGQIFKRKPGSFTGDLSTGTGTGLDGTLDLHIWDSHYDKDSLMPKAFCGCPLRQDDIGKTSVEAMPYPGTITLWIPFNAKSPSRLEGFASLEP